MTHHNVRHRQNDIKHPNRSTHICYLGVSTSINETHYGSERARRKLSDLDAGDAATQDRVESALEHVEFRVSGGEADWNRYHQHSPESITYVRCWPDTSKESTKSGRVTGQGSSRPVVTPWCWCGLMSGVLSPHISPLRTLVQSGSCKTCWSSWNSSLHY